MTTSGTASLAAALAKVQAALPKVERDRTVEVEMKNGDTYTYSYVTLANLSDAVLPLLAEHGLSFAALPGAGTDGKMCLRYHLLHESGEQLAGEFPISGEGGIQMIGGRITYARRYCLAALVGVAAEEDDDARLADDGARGTAQRGRQASRARQQPSAAEPRTAQRAARSAPAAAARPPLPGEEPEGQAMVNQQHHRAMHALWRDLGYEGEANRDIRLEVTSKLIGRKVESSATLTAAEAEKVIAALQQRKEATEKNEPAAAPSAPSDASPANRRPERIRRTEAPT